MDLEGRISTLEATVHKLHQFMTQQGYFDTPGRRTTRRTSLNAIAKEEPPWAKDLKGMLARVSSELVDVKSVFLQAAVANGYQDPLLVAAGSAGCPASPPLQPFATSRDQAQSFADQAPCLSGTQQANSPREELVERSATTPIADQKTLATCSSPDETGPDTSRSKFSLATEDMGDSLVANIARLVSDDEFRGKIWVEKLQEIQWADLRSRMQRPEQRDQFGNEYFPGTPGMGFSFLRMSTSSRFSFPHFPAITSRPSDDKIEAFLNEAAESPPRGNILYYVGPPLSPDFDSLLHPGEKLAQFTAIDGVNSCYWHAGQKFSGTAFHSEDGWFWSANLVLAGLKLWVVIAEYHTAIFEEFIRRNWKANRCAQFVRHLSLFISPRRLREEGIDFVVHCAGPGDMVITKPGQYHAVVNYTACFAISINFLLPGGSVIPSNLRVCKQCGLYNLKHSSLRKVPCPQYVDKARSNMQAARHGNADRTKRSRQPILVEQVAHPHKKPKTALVQPELQQMVMQARKVDEFCSIPSYSVKRPPPPEVFKLALLISSRPAIQQFCNLVRGRRDPNGDRAPLSLSDDVKTRIGQRISAIGRSQRRSALEQLQVRLNQFHLARDIERSKKDRIRADTGFISSILEQAQCSKSVFEKHRRLGNKWARLCRGRAELMCFIFLDRKNVFGLSPDVFLELDDDSLDDLHGLLDNPYISSICTAAKAFLQSLDDTSEDVEFRWEAEETPLDGLPEETMVSLLQPLPSVAKNTYEPESHQDSFLPKGWPENYPWPTDPTRIYDKSHMCDFCDEAGCECIRKIPTSLSSSHRPRIKDYGELGRGLQAVSTKPSQAAYATNDVIGFLTGEIVPMGTYNDGQALDFVRPDLPGEPVVCQIRGAGNCFRLLNHACTPSARLAQVRVSGRYMTAVKAVREILDGEQITVDHGKDWGKRQCL